MTLTGLPPSIDPAQRNSLFGTVQFIIDKMIKQEMDDILPCRVVAFDRHANRVSVQILITMIDTANKQVQRAQIAEVPVLQLGGGGFVLSFPIRAGDLGWIKATDVDISLFLQKAIISPPNTKIMHKFDSSIFIPDTMLKGVTIADADANNVVLQSLDGSTKISMGAGGVTIATSGAIALASASLTHNGINIGSTHVHPDPQGGVTGPPE